MDAPKNSFQTLTRFLLAKYAKGFPERSHLTVHGIQVDLVLVNSMTAEEIAEKKAKMEAINKATRFAKVMYQEEETEFSVFFKTESLTNGGTIFDVLVSHNDQETSHRIVVGTLY